MPTCPKGFPEEFFNELQPEAQTLTELTFSRMDEDCQFRVLESIKKDAKSPGYSRICNFMIVMMQECAEMRKRCDPSFHEPSSNFKKLN